MIDGLALRTDEVERIVQALVAAREVEVAGGTLRLAVRGEALLELGPGTRLAQMKFAPAGPYQAKVERGSLGVATLAPFGRRGMRVLTEDFEVTVAGTAFIVDIDATGSCVCVLEGRVRCDPTGDEPSREVEAGGLGFARRDRAPATWGPAHADHLEPLRELVSATNAGG
jgi:ferric-dicitrate binding protein FerR (iron transport regulator)